MKEMGKDHRLGEVAVERGLINSAELRQILKGQEHFVRANVRMRLGELMVSQEYISDEQLQALLDRQRSMRGTE